MLATVVSNLWPEVCGSQVWATTLGLLAIDDDDDDNDDNDNDPSL